MNNYILLIIIQYSHPIRKNYHHVIIYKVTMGTCYSKPKDYKEDIIYDIDTEDISLMKTITMKSIKHEHMMNKIISQKVNINKIYTTELNKIDRVTRF
jgi:hypothetical protein